MPDKYHVDVVPAPARFETVSKLNLIEQNRCLGCLQCAKRDCIYDVFTNRQFLPHELVDSGNRLCKACMRCVQECRNATLVRALNPEYLELGNAYWTPDIIASLWNQAETGKIPVSGAGYGGPFSGTGFDDMWTDMSEIVRPTRDGIHGREYINTAINIGGSLDRLHFRDGQLTDALPPMVTTPLPILLDLPPYVRKFVGIKDAVLHAARQLKLLAFDDSSSSPDEHIIARYASDDAALGSEQPHRIFEIYLKFAEPGTLKSFSGRLKILLRQHPNAVIIIGLPLNRHSREAVLQLVEMGVTVLRVYADPNGKEYESSSPRFIKDVVRDIHLALVQIGKRDRVTLLAGGGIAMAEHVAKLIACGADGVVVDDALLVALECRMCARHAGGMTCPVSMESIDAAWGAQRIINLLGSWHSQLIEVMGAMGLREVRRLRGEVGRVMFFNDLEAECFAPIFGSRIHEPG